MKIEEKQYVAGFIDTDGSIHVHIKRDNARKVGFVMTPVVSIDQKEKSAPYIAGVIDGDGYIGCLVKREHNKYIQISPHVRIIQEAKSATEELFNFLRRYCDSLGVSYGCYRRKNRWRTTMWTLYISSIEGVRCFLESIIPYLIVKKRQAVLTVEHLIPLIEKGKHRDKQTFLDLMTIADQINSLNDGWRRRRYKKSYFEELWRNDNLEEKTYGYRYGYAPYKEREWLSEKYLNERLSQQKIADICGVARTTIQHWIRKFGLKK